MHTYTIKLIYTRSELLHVSANFVAMTSFLESSSAWAVSTPRVNVDRKLKTNKNTPIFGDKIGSCHQITNKVTAF